MYVDGSETWLHSAAKRAHDEILGYAPMRVAHVIDYFHTDVGYQEYYLAKWMAEVGHTVRVISSGLRQSTVAIPGPDEEAGKLQLDAAGVDVVRLPARQLGHDRAWLYGLEEVLSEFRPTAVHCHGPFGPTAVRTAMAKRKLGYTLLVDNHAHEDIAPAAATLLGRAGYGIYRASAGPLLRSRVDTWVGIGPFEARFLRRRLGLGARSVKLIPLGFDPNIFRFDSSRRDTIRDRQGWSKDIVVVVTGKVYLRKRPDLVARACALMSRRLNVRLVVAGNIDADARAAVEREAHELVQQRRLEFLPMLGRRELADLYLASDAAVFARLPSISIYEAAGTGARVVVGRDVFSEWLQAQCANIEAADTKDLAPHLTPMPDRAARAIAAAAVFSWPVIGRQFLELYTTPAQEGR